MVTGADGQDVEIAIAVEIANSQAIALRVTQALPGVPEARLPLIQPDGGMRLPGGYHSIQPDGSLRFPSHHGVGIAIGVQVGEEDILDVTTTEAQT